MVRSHNLMALSLSQEMHVLKSHGDCHQPKTNKFFDVFEIIVAALTSFFDVFEIIGAAFHRKVTPARFHRRVSPAEESFTLNTISESVCFQLLLLNFKVSTKLQI